MDVCNLPMPKHQRRFENPSNGKYRKGILGSNTLRFKMVPIFDDSFNSNLGKLTYNIYLYEQKTMQNQGNAEHIDAYESELVPVPGDIITQDNGRSFLVKSRMLPNNNNNIVLIFGEMN